MANKYFNKQVSPKDYKTESRVGKMGGGMMMMDRPMMKKGGKVKMKKGSLSPEQKKIASAAEPKDKITGEDFAALRSNRVTAKKGGSVKDTHVTKDGRVAKKGLYYYMNRAKKLGKSKPGKGTVSDKALKASAKTAKK
jgi:predicted transcriptional regulator